MGDGFSYRWLYLKRQSASNLDGSTLFVWAMSPRFAGKTVASPNENGKIGK